MNGINDPVNCTSAMTVGGIGTSIDGCWNPYPIYNPPCNQVVVTGGYCPPRELLRFNVKGGGSIVVDIPLPLSAEQTKRLASIADKLSKALKDELA